MMIVSALLLTVAAAYTPPPANGDWTVSDVTSISGQTITLNGNLYIKANGRLELNDSTLKMNCASDGQYMIKVEERGELVLNGTTVTCTNTNWRYKFQIYGKATVTNSIIEEVWGPSDFTDWREAGVYIRTNDRFFFDNSKIISGVQTGITINSSNGTISNCTVSNNGDRGILIYGDAAPLIYKNTVSNNGRLGISQTENSHARITLNEIYDHRNMSIMVTNAYPMIDHNTLTTKTGNYVLYGIYNRGDSNATIEYNNITRCEFGISSVETAHPIISNNTIGWSNDTGIICDMTAHPRIEFNTIDSSGVRGIFNMESSTPTILHNIITANPCGIMNADGASPKLVGNNISGGSIGIINSNRSAVDITGNHLVDNLVCGVWNCNDTRVTINYSTIEGCQFGILNDNVLPVFINNNTIINNKFGFWNNGSGSLDIDNNNISDNSQAGIYNLNWSRPVIRNNNITSNLYVGINNTENSAATIENNDLSKNIFFGITIFNYSKPVINNNTITGHYEDGIFIGDAAEATISDNNEISGNRRAGVRCVSNATAHVQENNTIHDNLEDGIAGQDDSTVEVSNSTISSNIQNGIRGADRCTLTIEDNRLSNNGVNILVQGCKGSISRNNIIGGKCGISLYGTETSISDVDIDDSSSNMEKGIFLSNASPLIQGTSVNLRTGSSINCFCEARSSPRISGLKFEGDGTLYKVVGDSHPRLVGHMTNSSRLDIQDNSSIIIVDSFQLRAIDSQERPLDRATLSFDGMNLTTLPNGSTEWNEYEIITIMKIGLSPTPIDTTYNVTIMVDEDRWTFEPRSFANTIDRIFKFNFCPAIEPIPDIYVNEDQRSNFDLSPFISDRDNDTEEISISLSNGSEANRNVSIDDKMLELYYALPIDTDIIYMTASDGIRNRHFDVTVHVIARNDNHQYQGPSKLVLEEDVPYHFDLGQYIIDEDSNSSEFWIAQVDNKRPDAVEWAGLNLTFNYPEGITSDQVVITINGLNQTSCIAILDITIKPVNDPPAIADMPVFELTEGIEETIDLSIYIMDPDCPNCNLTLSVNSKFCTLIDGLKLTFNYPEGVLTDRFQITVWDGLNLVNKTIVINVTPVNTPPIFLMRPGFNAIAGKPHTVDIGNLIYDPDTPLARIVIRSGSPSVTISGTNITLYYPADRPSGTDTIRLILDDGKNSTTYDDIPVNVTAHKVEQIWTTKYSTYIYLLVPLALVAGAVAILAARRYLYGWYDIRRTFIVYQDGRMLAHAGEKADSDDEMLVSSMLTAVQQFIEEAMKKDQAGPIQEFQYKDMKIAVEKGRRIFLAVILKGYTTGGLRKQMKEIVTRIEREHEKELREWDGRMTRLPLIEEAVAELKKLAGKGPGT